MSDQEIPEVRFDESMATPIFPRPELKHAALVLMPVLAETGSVPTFIRPEWGGIQVFYGDYYAVIKDGVVAYGSAKVQWEAMHVQPTPGYWVKTAVPTAYQATQVCRIVTLIPDEQGTIREASHVLKKGDWIVRQPGGEVQHIKAEKYPQLYYGAEHASRLGLFEMSASDFASWAIAESQLQSIL